MVKRGFRAVYAPRAVALEKMTTDLEDEFRRKVRMFGHCWLLVLHGRMFSLRRLGPLYWVEMVSHRLLRYASGLLHLALLATSLVLGLQPGRRLRGRARSARGVRALRARLDRAARPRADLRPGPVLPPGRRWPRCSRSGTSRAACPPSGSARRARDEPAEGERVKRAIDIVGAAGGPGAGGPAAGAGGCAIKLEDGGPVLFRQMRLGRGARALRDPQAAHDDGRRREGALATASWRPAIRASRASATSCGAPRSTSCRSSGTCYAAT